MKEFLVLNHLVLPHNTGDLDHGNFEEVGVRDEINRFKGKNPKPTSNKREK